MTAEELGQMIWNVKELLRNVYDNKDVEDVILPFTLLRRLDCMGHRTKRFFQWSGKMGERF